MLADKLRGDTPIGYVEWSDYCQRVIRQRIEDGQIPAAPIFCDVRAFIDQGYARAYQGLVDGICAGFPCQPFSVAGHQKAEDDPRNMWPQTAECIRIIQPRYCELENVPGLIANGYITRVFSDLAAMGYGFAWGCMGAWETGSCVNGERLWIVAVKADSTGMEGLGIQTHIFTGSEESRRRQYSGAIGAMLPQDDFARVKRNTDAVAVGMERLKAIGNGQDPVLAATAFSVLHRIIGEWQ